MTTSSTTTIIVGQWWTTKKRGRDDEAIERDRMEAISRRKESNRRASTKSSRAKHLVAKTANKRGEEGRFESSSTSWVKSPCQTPRSRKHRSRKPISPQRELFPKKRRKRRLSDTTTSSILRTSNQDSKNRNQDYCRLCERCGGKIIKNIEENEHRFKTSTDPPPSKVTASKLRHGSRAHKRSRFVVTPEQECEKKYSSSKPKTNAYRSKRQRPCAKILSFGDEARTPVAFTNEASFSSLDSKKQRHSTSLVVEQRNRSCSKQKQRKRRRRETIARHRLSPLPDFARSAKCLYEFVRRPKHTIEQKTNVFATTIEGTTAKGTETNAAAKTLSSTALAKKLAVYDHLVAHSIAKTKKDQSESKFDFVQKNFLLGENNIGDAKHISASESSEKKVQSVGATKNFAIKSMKNINDTTTSSSSKATVDRDTVNFDWSTVYESSREKRVQSQWEGQKPMNHNIFRTDRTEGNTQKFITKQEEDDNPVAVPKYNPREQTFEKSQTTRKRDIRSDKSENTSNSLRRRRKNIEYFTGQEGTTGENDSPSQTPSTAPSAILSLPMNYFLSGSTQQSLEENKNSTRDECDEDTGSEKEDPLRDISFWRRIIEREEAIMVNPNQQKSFTHAIASLVLAKNPSHDDKSANHGSTGFLWLPSILEGGLHHTGLSEKQLQSIGPK